MIGTFHHQLVGKITFEDKKNGLIGIVEPLKQKGRSMDYLTGSITNSSGETLCQLSGNYMGYINFDSDRYFDVREMEICQVNADTHALESDSRKRIDSISLLEGNVEQA